jgi:PucR family transcriptional regulator, purine catabolism regulatory protein
MLTVRQLLALDLFAQSRLVAGEGGLDRQIHWAHVVDIPQAEEWVRRGELLLTTFYVLRDDEAAQAALCAQLAEMGLAGMVVATGKYVERVPDAVLAVANEANFPVIELPWEIAFEDVVRAVSEHSINDQFQLFKQSLAIHRSLTRVVLNGGSLKDVARELCSLLARPVEIDDLSFGVLAEASQSGAELDEVRRAAIRDGRNTPQLLAYLRASGILRRVSTTLASERLDVTPEGQALGMTMARILAPIVVARRIYGYVWIIAGDRELEPLDTHAIEHAATVAALILFREKTAHAADERAERNLLNRLLEEGGAQDSGLREQMARFRLRLDAPHAVIALDPGANDLRVVELVARNAARHKGLNAALGERADRCVVILETARQEQVESYCQHVLAQTGPLDDSLRIGASGLEGDARLLHRAYERAIEALEALPALGNERRMASFEELGLLHWLRALPQDLLNENIYIQRLQRLAEHDRTHGSQLTQTLETFLENDGNGVRTAQQLYIHRHTLKYRLQRIHEISDLDLDDSLCKLNLRAALLLSRMRAR